MPVTQLPALDRTSATFRDDVDSFFGTDLPAFSVEINALEDNVNAKESSAVSAAAAAAQSESNAANSASTASAAAGTATDKASEAGTFRNQAEAFKTQAEAFKTQAEAAAAAASGSAAFLDSNAIVKGSADETKRLRIEVDGLSAGATRTWTAPDADLTIVGTDTAQTLANKTLTAPVVNGYTEGSDSASGAAFSPNLTADTVFGYSTTGNTTITLPAPAAGKSFQLQITYGGAHSITWAGGAVRWAADAAPTPTSASGKTDVLNFTCNVAGTRWIGAVFAQNVGA